MNQTQALENNDRSLSVKYPVWFVQLLFVLLWSSGAIVIVMGLKYTNPFTFLFYRLLLATSLMCIIALVTKAPWPKSRQTLKKVFATGLLTQFGYVTSYFCALYYGASPTVMTIILGLQPVLTAVISSFFMRSSVSLKQYLGLFLSLLGAFITVIYDFSTQGLGTLGLIYSLICLASITVGSMVQKNNPEMDLRTGSALQFGISIIPVGILTYFFGTFELPSDIHFILALGWMTLIVSVSATCLYYKLLRDGNAVKVNSLFYLIPAVTAVLCFFIFDTAITLSILVGIVLIVLGVFITQK